MVTQIGRADVVEHLINTGVDANSQDREGPQCSEGTGQFNCYKIIKTLILCGADVVAQKTQEPGVRDEQKRCWTGDGIRLWGTGSISQLSCANL